VVSNRQARAATKAYIKSKLKMELTDSKLRSIDKKAAWASAASRRQRP
jgi:hypothetical protein